MQAKSVIVVAFFALVMGLAGGIMFGAWTENNRMINLILNNKIAIQTNHVPHVVLTP